jgi:beta-lactamase class A
MPDRSQPTISQPTIGLTETPPPAVVELSNSIRATPPSPQYVPPLKQASSPPPKPRPALLLMFLRFTILGVGVAALTGTVLNILQPRLKPTSQRQAPPPAQAAVLSPAASGDLVAAALRRGQRLTSIEQQIRQLATERPGLTPSMFFLSMDSDDYVDINGSQVYPAASTIKSPILIAFFQDVDAGKIRLDEQLVMRPDLIATEAGTMQYQKPGSKFSALETATLMITISDNTATNMLIDRLGGSQALNQRFKSWGLNDTVIRNWLPDLQGTNTTSARDQATMMYLISKGELISVRSRDRMLDIMRRTVTDTLLPAGLAEGAVIAHKTGDIGTVIGDAGIIDAPNGQRYVAAIMVRRPFNDVRGRELVQQISRLTYQTFSQPIPRPSSSSPTGSPSATGSPSVSPSPNQR